MSDQEIGKMARVREAKMARYDRAWTQKITLTLRIETHVGNEILGWDRLLL